MKLSRQEQKVWDFIEKHPRCTKNDIYDALKISCSSARITEINKKYRKAGLEKPIVWKEQKKFAGARPFSLYEIAPLYTLKETPPFKEIPVSAEAKQLALRLAV